MLQLNYNKIFSLFNSQSVNDKRGILDHKPRSISVNSQENFINRLVYEYDVKNEKIKLLAENLQPRLNNLCSFFKFYFFKFISYFIILKLLFKALNLKLMAFLVNLRNHLIPVMIHLLKTWFVEGEKLRWKKLCCVNLLLKKKIWYD